MKEGCRNVRRGQTKTEARRRKRGRCQFFREKQSARTLLCKLLLSEHWYFYRPTDLCTHNNVGTQLSAGGPLWNMPLCTLPPLSLNILDHKLLKSLPQHTHWNTHTASVAAINKACNSEPRGFSNTHTICSLLFYTVTLHSSQAVTHFKANKALGTVKECALAGCLKRWHLGVTFAQTICPASILITAHVRLSSLYLPRDLRLTEC